MNQRLLIRLGLAIGFIAFLLWIASNTYWEETTVPTPLKGEAVTNPFYAAERLVRNLGATSSWDRLQADVPTDAVMVVSSWHWDLVGDRRARMERWVEEGGRLVLDRSLVGGEEVFEAWTGISQKFPEPEDDEEEEEASGDAEEEAADDGKKSMVFVPRDAGGGCRTLQDGRRSDTEILQAAEPLELCAPDDGTYLMSTRKLDWAMRDGSGMQALRVNVGKGSVTVINAVPFRSREMLRGDHARLLVEATQLRRGDEVHFLSEDEQPSILTLMWMFGWPTVALFLAFVALALWRNGVRFGPLAAQPAHARRSLAEQIRGTGQFSVRFGGGKSLHAAAVRALNEAAQRRVAAYRRYSAAERVEAIARLTGIDASLLGPAINHSGSRRPHELRNAIALVETARRILNEKSLVHKGSIHGNRVEHDHARG